MMSHFKKIIKSPEVNQVEALVEMDKTYESSCQEMTHSEESFWYQRKSTIKWKVIGVTMIVANNL